MQEQGPYLIDQVMGNAIERKFLLQLDPLTAAGPDGQTAAQRLETLDANLLEIKALTSGVAEAMAAMDDAQLSKSLAQARWPKRRAAAAGPRWTTPRSASISPSRRPKANSPPCVGSRRGSKGLRRESLGLLVRLTDPVSLVLR